MGVGLESHAREWGADVTPRWNNLKERGGAGPWGRGGGDGWFQIRRLRAHIRRLTAMRLCRNSREPASTTPNGLTCCVDILGALYDFVTWPIVGVFCADARCPRFREGGGIPSASTALPTSAFFPGLVPVLRSPLLVAHAFCNMARYCTTQRQTER